VRTRAFSTPSSSIHQAISHRGRRRGRGYGECEQRHCRLEVVEIQRGALVRGLTPREVREIYAVREELEVMAVRIIPFPVAHQDIERLEELQRQHTAAVAAGDLLTVFYRNLSFHRVLYGLCRNACLIETIDLLAQKVYGIRSYASAPESLDRARRDHLEIIKTLRGSRRDDLVALTRRHLKPSPEAYIKDYERRFGKADLIPAH